MEHSKYSCLNLEIENARIDLYEDDVLHNFDTRDF